MQCEEPRTDPWASPTESFLRSFHARYAHAEGALFDAGQIAQNRSSYDLLLESVSRTHARSVLDVGCGDGALPVRLHRECGVRTTGLDFSPELLAVARSRAPKQVHLLCARAQAMPLAGAAVDAVVSHMALMLMDDFERVLHEVRRVLKPGGTFCAVVSAPSPPSPESDLFFSELRQLLQSEQLTPRFGPDCFRSEQAIQDAWMRAGFEAPAVDNHVLTRRVPAAALWTFFSQAYYPVALLSEPGQARLAGLVTQRLRPHIHDGHLSWRSGIRSIRVTR